MSNRDVTFTIPAGQGRDIRHLGTVFALKAVSPAALPVLVSFDDEEPRAYIRGAVVQRVFDRLRLTHTHGGDMTVTVEVGDEPIRDGLASLTVAGSVDFGGVSQPIDIQNWPANPIQGTFTPEVFDGGASPADAVLAAGVGQVVSAARGTKRETWVTSLDTNTGTVRVGVGAASGAGQPLLPGSTAIFEGSMAISAFNDGAAAAMIAITEVDKL